ncbi:hypothetical protein TrST_g309 [Triparma strigata]|uniref:Uncharacterized protein n=1 Tax=Triparma strigata TaxID=1606541 RepID=A0A9W7DUT1_9STRA|nr:hypothetical protein TrST_g309 [Triparma strigata]
MVARKRVEDLQEAAQANEQVIEHHVTKTTVLTEKNKILEMELEELRRSAGDVGAVSARKLKEAEDSREQDRLRMEQQRQEEAAREEEEKEERRRMEQERRIEEGNKFKVLKADLANAEIKLSEKDEELCKKTRAFRVEQSEIKEKLYELEEKYHDLESRTEDEKRDLKRIYQQQEKSLKDRIKDIESDKEEAEKHWLESKETADALQVELAANIKSASENEQQKEEELYGANRHSLTRKEKQRLEEELAAERLKSTTLLNNYMAQVQKANEIQSKFQQQVEHNQNVVSSLERKVAKNGQKLDAVQDNVAQNSSHLNKNTALLLQNSALLNEIDATTRNNIKRITNLLNTKLTVPNLILIVPSLNESMRQKMLTSGWPSPKNWFKNITTKTSFDLHIICPLTKTTSVTFGIPEPKDFIKNNSSLVKCGLMALRYSGCAVRIVAKAASSGLIELPELDIGGIEGMFEGMDGLGEGLGWETEVLGGFVDSNRNGLDCKRLTGGAYERLKGFLEREGRMEKVREMMGIIEVEDNEKMWVAKDRDM